MKTIKKYIINILKIFFGGLLFVILGLFIFAQSQTPSLERDWTLDQKILADISISGNNVNIKNIRDFTYTTTEDYQVGYKDGDYNLEEIETLYYAIEPFGEFEGPAHTLVSFGFENGEYLVISAEIRKEKGESFHPLLGILNQYEMTYVIGTEEDLIQLRANHRRDEVFLYPIQADKKRIQALFLSMLERATKLSQQPQFYNTLTNNCTTSILAHVNELRDTEIPWSIEALMPSGSDKVIYDLGLIDTNLSLTEVRDYYKINSLSEEYLDTQEYSKNIRKQRK